MSYMMYGRDKGSQTFGSVFALADNIQRVIDSGLLLVAHVGFLGVRIG